MDHSSPIKQSKSVREVVFMALWKGFCKDLYLEDVLSTTVFTDPRDQSLAYEICCGTIRMWIQMQWLAEQLTTSGKLSLKNREKSLLFSALYQIYYLDRVPHYAIIDETVKLAKKHCHTSIGSFLNGILRKASQTPLALPEDNSLPSLSIRFSQPQFFIEQLIQQHDLPKTLEILKASNARPQHFVRSRSAPFDYTPITSDWDNADGYIQNPTPGFLMKFLSDSTPPPSSILDLCASPGGKLLLAHDLYRAAKLWANDISDARIQLLNENIAKFELEVDVRVGTGESYPLDKQFDLIILDLPCSNSGVLNKRVEARSRLTKESLESLKQLQDRLLKHAASLLKPGGSIWYMTCSILQAENEAITAVSYLQKKAEMTRLPDLEGNDGGYCCLLST